MRIVGGPHDGINVWIGAGKDDVKLPNQIGDDCLCAMSLQRFTRYTVRHAKVTCVSGVHDIKFLAPEDCDDGNALEAFARLFEPQGGIV